MNTLKRIFAIVLCVALTLTCLVGCHKKGEIAVKIGDVEFTSGYYACALVYADMEARSLVEEALSAEGDLPTDLKHWKHKVEDTDYVKWVEDKALSSLKELAAVKTLCAKSNVTLDAETTSLAESGAEYLWTDYGYSDIMENNGVGKETFEQYMRDTYLTSTYFEYLYGKGGEEEIPADQVKQQLVDNYVLANVLSVDFSSLSDEEKADKTAQFTAYETALKNGTKTFEEIYLEFNNVPAESHTHEEAKEGESAPLDPHADLLGSEETDDFSEHFETAKAMATGEIKLVTLEEGAGLVLLIKQDILSDPYYLENLDLSLRNQLMNDTYTDNLAKHGDELECVINDSSTKQFKVKKIYYPEGLY